MKKVDNYNFYTYLGFIFYIKSFVVFKFLLGSYIYFSHILIMTCLIRFGKEMDAFWRRKHQKEATTSNMEMYAFAMEIPSFCVHRDNCAM